jgi:hypothetical protein
MNQGCFLSDIQIAQLGDLQNLALRADETLKVLGPDPLSYRIAWLLSMCFAIHDEARAGECVRGFGWVSPEEDWVHDGLSHQISWDNHDFVRSFLMEQREFSMKVCVELNGAILGWIRGKAKRSPEIIQALMQEPTCSFRFSILIDNLFSVASCVYSDVQIGNWTIPISDKPEWISLLLLHLQGVFCFSDRLDVPQLAKNALLSWKDFESYERFCDALRAYGVVRVVEGKKPFLLLNNEPLRMYGPRVQNAIQQAGALYLKGASVVWIPEELLCTAPENVQVWMACPAGSRPGAPLESKTLSWNTKQKENE